MSNLIEFISQTIRDFEKALDLQKVGGAVPDDVQSGLCNYIWFNSVSDSEESNIKKLLEEFGKEKGVYKSHKELWWPAYDFKSRLNFLREWKNWAMSATEVG